MFLSSFPPNITGKWTIYLWSTFFSCLFSCMRHDTLWVLLHCRTVLKIIMFVLSKQASGFWDHIAMLACYCMVQLIDTTSLTGLLVLFMLWMSSAGATLSPLHHTSLCNRDMLGGILIKCRQLLCLLITTVIPVNGEKQLLV